VSTLNPPPEELRFDGRVAVVTGAGGQAPSLGHAYALLLASRGAKVVVNDLGVGPDGRGGLAANADRVVQEILDAGGEAVADLGSVADSASALGVVQTALDAWGRVDILVNNAGVLALALFDEVSEADAQLIVDTHLLGTIWMCRAAWPRMREARYGRIVNTSSSSMFGAPYNAVYGAAKSGIWGLTRGLALEGSLYGINVNALTPQAGTKKHAYLMDESAAFLDDGRERKVEQVAPLVAYLCHESCEASGRMFYAGGGMFSEWVFQRTSGLRNAEPTIEDLRDGFDQIGDRAGAAEPVALDTSWYDRMRPKQYVPR
jgi:NAD(P)-dependent dehydrogenase (short-subunit alcohol dehydrogenase family)